MIFGDYITAELLGSGSYSNVYRIKDEQLAIKVYDSFDHYTPNESHIMSLNISSVPKMVDLIYDKNLDTFGLVMELTDCTLSQYITNVNMDNFRKRHFIMKIAQSITELHFRGFSHSDIKMDNILVKDDEPYLSDFSVSSTFSSIDPECIMSEEYQSPEIRSKSITPREEVLRTSDSWAFGCLCVLIYLSTPGWVHFSYNTFIDFIREEGKITDLITTKLDQEDIELLEIIQAKYLNIDYSKREWYEFTIGYPVNITVPVDLFPPVKMSKTIAKFFDKAKKNNISQDAVEKAYRLYNLNVHKLKKSKEVTKFKEWRQILLYICLDICCVIYKCDDAMPHKFYRKLSKCKHKHYMELYTLFVVGEKGYFPL